MLTIHYDSKWIFGHQGRVGMNVGFGKKGCSMSRSGVTLRVQSAYIASAIMLGLAATGCGRHSMSEEPDPVRSPVSVRVYQVALSNTVASSAIVGTIRSRHRATIESRLAARIDVVPVVEGQRVEAGVILVQLDYRDIQARLDEALARQSSLDGDFARAESLLKQGVISQQDRDHMEASALAARASVSELNTMLGYTVLRSPFTGVIARKHVAAGDLAMPGKPLLELDDPDSLQFEMHVPEDLIGRLQADQHVSIHLSAGEGDIVGTVAEIGSAGDPVSHSYRVALDVDSTNGLRIGQFGRASIPIRPVSSLTVPASAVFKRGQLEYIYVVADQRAWLRIVRTGRAINEDLLVLSGLDAGEWIVVNPPVGMTEGQRVEPLP
jgi:RND family efflux transporter MFP subunit